MPILSILTQQYSDYLMKRWNDAKAASDKSLSEVCAEVREKTGVILPLDKKLPKKLMDKVESVWDMACEKYNYHKTGNDFFEVDRELFWAMQKANSAFL